MRNQILLGILVVLLLTAGNLTLMLVNRPQPQGEVWRVTDVLSGQLVEIAQGNKTEKLRLIGVTAPLLEQAPFGAQARLRLQELVQGQEVLVELDINQRDRAERLLGYVWKDGQMVNQQLVNEGYALTESVVPNVKYKTLLDNAQSRARLLELGIWNPQQPLRQAPASARRRRVE